MPSAAPMIARPASSSAWPCDGVSGWVIRDNGASERKSAKIDRIARRISLTFANVLHRAPAIETVHATRRVMRLPKRSPIQLARNDVTRMGKYCACGVSDYTAETVQGAPAHKDGADETERAVRGRVEELEPLGVSLHGVEEGSWRVQYKSFFFGFVAATTALPACC